MYTVTQTLICCCPLKHLHLILAEPEAEPTRICRKTELPLVTWAECKGMRESVSA